MKRAVALHCAAALAGTAPALAGTGRASPALRGGSCDITSFGAVGDNATDCTAAIQAAIAACDEVVVPAGAQAVYLTRSLDIRGRSNLSVVIQAGATLIARDPDSYPTDGATLALFNGGWADSSNLSFSGGGTLDGQGWRWWPRAVANWSYVRPQMVFLGSVNGLTIRDLTIVDSPYWTLYCRGSNMLFENVTILNNAGSCGGYFTAPNTDGFNIGGNNITVRNGYVHNGDDCVPIDTIASNVLVEDVQCHCGTNGGVPLIGDYTDLTSGIQNVTFRRMLVNGTNQGAGVKISNAGEVNSTHLFNAVRNVTWEDITILNPRAAALYIDMYAEDAFECAYPPSPDRGPRYMGAYNLTFRNIHATVAPGQAAGCFLCNAGTPCHGLTFDNVTVVTANGTAAAAYTCGAVDGSSVQGAVSPPPCGV